MKIVHLGKYYPPARGGIETHTQTLAQSQAALGCTVTVVVINHEMGDHNGLVHRAWGKSRTREEFDGQVRVVRVGRIGHFRKFDVTTNLRSTLYQLQLEQQDIWHLHMPNVSMLLAAARMRQLHPLVVTHHSDVVRQRILKYLYRPLENYLYDRAELILSDSPTYIDGSATLQKFRDKVHTLPLGIDLKELLHPSGGAIAFANELRSNYGEPLWLCVGRLIYYKGLHVAISALKDVPGRLLVVGTGPEESSLRALAKELGVDDRVIWIGSASSDQLVGAYQAATALWFPSNARSEGFGLVQVEAMASGCPIINTNIPGSGVAWVSRHEETGLTIPMNDSASLASAARQLLDNPNLRAKLAANGRFVAQQRFDSYVMGQNSLAIYDDVRSGKHGSSTRQATEAALSAAP